MKKTSEAKVKSKKKINIKIIIIFLILGLIIALFAVRSTLKIRSIEVIIENTELSKVENNEATETEPETTPEPKVTKEKVIELSELKIGDRLYKNLRSEIANKIEQNPYIEKAEISRNFSGKLKIKITQREHKYMMNYSGQFLYIDREGYVLEVSGENNGDPIIIGLVTDCSSLSVGNTKIRLNKQDLERLEVVNNIMSALESNGITNRVYTINVQDENDFVLELDDDQKSVHIGNGTDLNIRVLYIKKILESEAGHRGIIYVNGNLDESYVYFKEQ